MNGDGTEISRATFSGMPTKDKLNVLFDFLQATHSCGCENKKALNELEKKVDRRWKWNASLAMISGFIGGVCAHVGQWIITGGSKPPTGV